MRPDLTLVLTYYDAPRMLERHLQEFAHYPPGVILSLCDDGSASPPPLHGCPIPYIHRRLEPDGTPWRQDAARNAAMTGCAGLCMVTDIDHVLTADSARVAIERRHAPARAYRPRRVCPNGLEHKRHPNSYLIDAADYWRTGGYDERLCGWYGTDGRWQRQLARAGVEVCDAEDVTLTLFEGIIDDAIADLPRKGSPLHAARSDFARAILRDSNLTLPAHRFRYPCELVADTTGNEVKEP